MEYSSDMKKTIENKNNKKKIIFCILFDILSIVFIVLSFMNICHYTGFIPGVDSSGKNVTTRVEAYESFYSLFYEELPILFNTLIAVFCLPIATSIVFFITKNKKVYALFTILTLISACCFIFVRIIALIIGPMW